MRSVICILLIAGASLSLSAQKHYNDAQLRTNLSLTWKMNKRWSLHFDQQDRFQKNMSTFTRASFDFGVAYRITKNIRLKADYVYIQRLSNRGYWRQRNWYYLAAVFKGETGRWKFFYRQMVQARFGNTNSENSGLMRLYDRNKFTIRHETTKRISLWAAEELYIPINSPSFLGIERSRTFVGTTIKTWKGQSLDLYFMYQAFLHDNEWFDSSPGRPELPRRDFIYGINYNFEF